jgi:uncharacterized protein
MYRLSKYNYFIPYSGRVIFFNGLSGHVFSTTEKEYRILQSQLDDPISFNIQYNSVFNKFKEWGFIVDAQKDELDVIRLRNRREVFSNRNYHLVINPTLDCNFNCWYCYENHPKGYMSLDTINLVKKHIQWMVNHEKIDGLNLSWFGGEPLMYFDEIIYPIAQYAQGLMKKHDLTFQHSATTNAYLINHEMVDKFIELELDGFQITIDGDEKRHDQIRNVNGSPSFQKIMNNINLLCEKIPSVNITLRVNYDKKTLERCHLDEVFSMIPQAYRKQISVNFQRVWQTYDGTETEYEKRLHWQKYSDQLGFRPCYISNSFTVNKGTVCYVDRFYHTEINYDGKIFKCTARDYSDKYVKGVLMDDGQIKWNQDVLSRQYGKATFENEMCVACKHLPICNGPCSQKIIETPHEKLESACALKSSEITPESFIIDLYEKKIKQLNENENNYQ